jgi:hypothetical protein
MKIVLLVTTCLTFGKGLLEDSIAHLSFTKLATAYSGRKTLLQG